MVSSTRHAPKGKHQTRKSTASGWRVLALEYYDFLIDATTTSLILPQICVRTGDPTGASVAKSDRVRPHPMAKTKRAPAG